MQTERPACSVPKLSERESGKSAGEGGMTSSPVPVTIGDLAELDQLLADLPSYTRKVVQKATEADDFARRLAEKGLYRRLLADDQQDAMRFRYWFKNYYVINMFAISENPSSKDIDAFRTFVDERMDRDRQRDRSA